jgi:DNA-binding transcriptional LysR family regulator
MDLLKLEVFLHSAESLHFSTTGKRMHLSQSTISHHTRDLENELGVELFERSAGGLYLTGAGHMISVTSSAAKVL